MTKANHSLVAQRSMLPHARSAAEFLEDLSHEAGEIGTESLLHVGNVDG